MHTQSYSWSPYGAFELKVSYQRSMLIGTLTACLMGILVITGMALMDTLTFGGSVTPAGKAPDVYVNKLPAPRPISHKPAPPVVTLAAPVLLRVGIPNPVPDDQAVLFSVTPTRFAREQAALAGDSIGAGEIVVGAGDMDVADMFPAPDEFIPYDEQPVLIEKVEPKYPEIARRAGITADVWLNVAVDRNGNVREVRLVRADPPNLGFEDEAIAAAMKLKYRPAMQNGQPVNVWVSQRVKFRLRSAGAER